MGETIPVVIVAGPTASGKSGLALRLAEDLGGVVINADSMQVYRELRVLTSRPDTAALARVPHALYGVLPGAERCSTGRWRALALAEIEAAHGLGKVPVVTGGTGLYIKALSDGLAPVPEIPQATIAAAEARLTEIGGEAFRAELAARDPAAGRLVAGDRQRLVRAWAVLEATGRTLSDWQAQAKWQDQDLAGDTRLAPVSVLLEPPREALYAACDARFEGMLAAGALDEVRALLGLGLAPDLPVMKAVGVPELGRHLAGETDRDTAVAKAQQATRNLAKRQYTWFRHQFKSELRVSEQYSERIFHEIFSDVRRFLLTRQN